LPLNIAARGILLAAVPLAALAACSRHAAEPLPPVAAGTPAAPPAGVPPELAGVWTSTRGPVMRCIEMHPDGLYLMVPNTEAGDRTEYHGTWRVAGDRITWRDASQGDAPDTNRMVDVSDGRFSTVEADQSLTQFQRIAGTDATCPR
jgi:hypothetical protein